MDSISVSSHDQGPPHVSQTVIVKSVSPASCARDSRHPIRGQYPGHVIRLDQSEARDRTRDFQSCTAGTNKNSGKPSRFLPNSVNSRTNKRQVQTYLSIKYHYQVEPNVKLSISRLPMLNVFWKYYCIILYCNVDIFLQVSW